MFIVFEGGEGCGKSTQARILYRRLRRRGIPALLTHEPGGTPLGRRLRGLLKRGDPVAPETELLLFAASRAQLVVDIICPALEQGKVVISDRYVDSTLAYQGYGRGLAPGSIQKINDFATQGLRPDLVILLDISPTAGLGRKAKPHQDRFEQEEIAFHHRVRQGYLELAQADPARWSVIDASKSKREVADIIWERVQKLLPEKRTP